MDGLRRDRTEDHRLTLLDASFAADEPDANGLGLIVRDLARAVGAEIAFLMVPGEGPQNVEVLATWGVAGSDGGLPTAIPADGFIGRALQFERTAVEPIDSRADRLGKLASVAGITHAVGAPVTPLIGPRGVLCAAFSSDPSGDVPTTLWLAESYARLAALCLQDRDALDGLLSGGRLDGLTGCLTQTAFLQEIRRGLARCERHGRPLSCSFIDLDHFKRVNSHYGHLHGSRVLAGVAAILREGIRDGDALGRYGGDEFVVLLPDTDEATAVEVSGRLRATIARTMINLPHDPIDASIGVAEWRPGSAPQALLGTAYEALLAAKAAGGAVTIGASALDPSLKIIECDSRFATGGAITEASPAVSLKDVLEVSAQFDEFGGASIELTAWELDAEPADVLSAWSLAIKEGFLEPGGTDRPSGEEMWRLSDHGRRALDTGRCDHP